MKSFNHVILVLMPVCVIFIEVCFVKAYAQLADTMLCSDESCSETLSEGEARLAYRPRDDKFLNLKKGDIVLVKSKNAGKKTHLWGGEVMGSDRFGFFPSAFIKEYMVLVKSPNTSVSVQEFLRKRRSPIPEDPYADLVSPDKVVAKDYQDDGIQPGDKKDDTLHPGSPTQDVSDQKKERNEEVQQSTEDEQKMDHENPVAEEANELSQQKQDQSETPSKEEVTEKQSNDVDEHDTSHSHEEKNDEGVEKSQQDYALDASHKHEEGEHPDKAGKSDSEPVKLYDSDANDHSTNKKLDGAGGELKDSLKNIPPDIAALLGDPLMKKQEDSSETGAKKQTGDKVPSKEIDEKSKGDHDEKEAEQDASDDERQQTSDVTSHKTGENHEDDRQSSESTNEEQNKVKKEENVDADEESDEDHMEESHEQESGQYIPEVATDQDSPETVDGERKEATSIDEIKQVETKIHGKDDAIEEIKNVQKENDTSNKRWENHEGDKQSSESTNEKQDKVKKEEKVDAGEESQEEDHMKESDQQESGPYTPEMETDEESPGTIDSEGKEATDIGKTEQDGKVDAGEESESLQKENVADDKKESNSQVSSEPIHKDDQESPGEIDDERKEASDIGEAKQDGTENDGKVDASEESLQKENDADDKKESNDQGSGKPIYEEAENHEGDQESPGPTESEQKEATDTEMGEKSENPPKEGVETKDHIGSETGENSSQDAASGEVEGDPTDPKNDVESSIHEKDRDGGDDEDLREQQQSNEIRDGEDDSQPSGKGAKQGHAGQGVDEKDRNEADLTIEENGKQQSDEKPQDFPSGTKPDTISATLTQGVALKTEDGKAESKTTSKHQEKADEKVDVTIHKDSHGDSEDQESVKKSDDHGSDSKESDNLVGKEDDNENKENQDTEILPDNIGGAKQSGTDKGAETNARDVITSEPQSNGTETAKTSESIANVTIQKEAANTAEPIDPQRLRKDNENEAKETDHLLVDGGSSDEKSPQTMKKDPERDVLDGGGLPKDEMEDNIIANARDGTAEEHSSQDTPVLQMANADNGKNTAKMEDNEQLQDEVKTDSYDALHEGEIVSWDETIDEDLEKLRPPGWDEALGGDDEDTNIVKEERTENPERSDDTSLHDGHNESDIGERQDGAASHPRDESIVEGTHQKDAKVEPAAHEDEDSHENNSGIQPTAAPGEHRDENVTTISDLIHATEATQMSGMENAADEEHLDTLNDSTAAEPIEHKDEVGADAADTASDARETEDTPGGNIDDDMGSDEGEVGAESDLHVESLPLRLLIVLYHFPFDILYILEPFFLLWISLLPEEYQNDVHGVSWSVVTSTFFIGFFMMWLLICRLRASSRKRKDELAVKTVQELRTQLDNIIQEKLERENELKAKQIELGMQRDEITTVAQEKFNIVTEKTTLEHSLREYSIQNDAFKRDVQVLNQQLQEKDNEMQEVLTNSDQVRNSLSAQQETISRYEDKIRQLQDVVTESGSDKKRMEDAIEKYKERVKALEKAKGETKREGKTWKDQAEKLNEKILDLEENLNAQKEEADLKRQEVDVLKDCILQFKGVQEYLTDEGEDAESEESIEKQKEKMRSMIDVSLVRSQLRQIEADRLQITYELEAEKKSRAETEGKVSELEATIQSNQTMKNKLERDRQTLESKLAVMQEFYAKREVEIQSKLGLEQSKRESNASMLEDHQKQHLELVQQLEAYKKMGEDAKHQYEEAERQHKQEILGFEKKKHENWLASRDAERKLDEANKQINQLHVELSDMQRRLRDSQEREPILRPRPERHGPPGAPPPFGPPRRGPPPGIPGSPLHFRNGPPPDIDRRSPPPFNRRPPSPGSSISEEKLSRPDRPPSRPDRPPSTHSLPPLDRRPPPGPPMGPGLYPGPPPPGRFGPYRDGMPRVQGPRGYHPHSRPPPGPRMGGPMTSSPYMEQSPIPPSASPGPRSQNFTQSSLHAPPPQMAGDSLRNEGLQPPPMGSNVADHPPQGTPTGRSSGASNPFRRAH